MSSGFGSTDVIIKMQRSIEVHKKKGNKNWVPKPYLWFITFLKDKIHSFHQNILNKNTNMKSLARNPYSLQVFPLYFRTYDSTCIISIIALIWRIFLDIFEGHFFTIFSYLRFSFPTAALLFT